MGGKDKKREFFSYLPYECEAVETYLEQMAQKGWLLTAIKGYYFYFKRIEPKKLRYSVDVFGKVSSFDHKDSDVALEYREYCAAAGWIYVCENGKIQIFYTEEENEVISIHTDEEEKFKSVFKASIYNVGTQLFMMLIAVFTLYMLVFMGDSSLMVASNICIIGLLAMLSTIFRTSITLISFIKWVIKAKRNIKINKQMVYSNYKQMRIKNTIIKCYILILLFMLIVSMFIDNADTRNLNIIICGVIIIALMFYIVIKKIIGKKKYSKDTNMLIIIGSNVGTVVLTSILMIGVCIWFVTTGVKNSIIPTDKELITLSDFGFKENDKEVSAIFDKSVLAQRETYYCDNGVYTLDSKILESKYNWVVDLNKNTLLYRLNVYGDNIKLQKTNLPSNITVYSNKDTNHKRPTYILASQNKVVEIRKEFKDMSDDEFLDKIYKKVLE